MALTFRKRIKIGGVNLNIGKKGISSVSVGGKGFTMNLSGKGVKNTVSAGGFSYSSGGSKGSKGSKVDEGDRAEAGIYINGIWSSIEDDTEDSATLASPLIEVYGKPKTIFHRKKLESMMRVSILSVGSVEMNPLAIINILNDDIRSDNINCVEFFDVITSDEINIEDHLKQIEIDGEQYTFVYSCNEIGSAVLIDYEGKATKHLIESFIKNKSVRIGKSKVKPKGFKSLYEYYTRESVKIEGLL